MEWKFEAGAPIYAQIVETLRVKIVSGSIRPGEKLAPVRELALEAGVNPNTMQRALTELEREGLLYTRRTSGRFVTEDAGVLDAARRDLARRKLRAFLESMGELGFTGEELLALLKSENISEEEER